MKLEQQVCSLELARRLKEIGVRQESYLAWCDCDVHGEYDIREFAAAADDRRIAAFTVAELGEMLPEELLIDGEWTATLEISKGDNAWHVYYHNDQIPRTFHLEYADTEADARAKMLIYLLENKLITV